MLFRRLQRRIRSDKEGRVSLLIQLFIILLLRNASISLYFRICLETVSAAGASWFVNSVLHHDEWDSKVVRLLLNFLMLCFGIDIVIRGLEALGIPVTHWLRALHRYLRSGRTAPQLTPESRQEQQPAQRAQRPDGFARKLIWLAALALMLAVLVGGAAGFYLHAATPH